MKTYNAIQGDTWDSIAKKALGSEFAMPELIRANRSHITKRIFSGGEKIAIPDIPTPSVVISPPWKNP